LDKPHRKLEVWQRGVALTTQIYTLTGRFPPEERYGLSSQMRRAAVSIPSNLAEGAARGTKEFAQFILIAIGSVSELDTQLEIAFRLGYVSNPLYQSLNDEMTQIDRMLIALRKSIIKRL
jgi:four helix bundle protein